MKDKLPALREIMSQRGINVPLNIGRVNSVEFMNSFFNKVNKIRTVMSQIEYYYKQIVKLHNEILSSPDQNNDDKNELEIMMEAVKRDTGLVRMNLKEIENEIDNAKHSHIQNQPVEIRIKITQHASLSYQFSKLIINYNLAQVEFRKRCKDRIKRQLAMANRKIEDDELEDMLEQESVAIFTQEIVTETEQAKKSLEDVEARHADILKLERSIKDLHEMFLDMALLIEGQGEMIDRIEYNVAKASDYIEQAVIDTQKAVEYQGRARKKKVIIILVIVLVIIIIIAAIVGGVVGK